MVTESKKQLRREMKVVLANLDPRWEQKANAEVCSQLVRLVDSLVPAGPNRNVLAWVPCFPGEVDLAEFMGEMLKNSNVYLPLVDENNTMSFAKVGHDWSAALRPGPRGIVQPENGYGELFDGDVAGEVVVVVPGIAFDVQGHRLGRGAGHYDRFLSQPRLARAHTIGVCWSMQVVPHIPVDAYDINIHWVCHERGALRAEER